MSKNSYSILSFYMKLNMLTLKVAYDMIAYVLIFWQTKRFVDQGHLMPRCTRSLSWHALTNSRVGSHMNMQKRLLIGWRITSSCSHSVSGAMNTWTISSRKWTFQVLFWHATQPRMWSSTHLSDTIQRRQLAEWYLRPWSLQPLGSNRCWRCVHSFTRMFD